MNWFIILAILAALALVVYLVYQNNQDVVNGATNVFSLSKTFSL